MQVSTTALIMSITNIPWPYNLSDRNINFDKSHLRGNKKKFFSLTVVISIGGSDRNINFLDRSHLRGIKKKKKKKFLSTVVICIGDLPSSRTSRSTTLLALWVQYYDGGFQSPHTKIVGKRKEKSCGVLQRK